MSIQRDFTNAGQAYAEQLRAKNDAAAQAKAEAKAQREQTTNAATAWLQQGIDQLQAETPNETMTDAAKGSDDFNRFFGIK